MMNNLKKLVVASALTFSATTIALADGIERHPIPNSDFPILQAVTVEGAEITYLSGTVPQKGEDENFGDTEAQTVSVFNSISDKLAGMGLEMSDVIKMTVFLVPTEETGRIDFSGFMEGYTQFFGTDDQPNLPTRSVIGVSDLANEEWLVEIEVVAATSD
ncbi:RidA family protein [Halovibrio sp. HP20-50]|uniref:RidA family protein n=1 Tax=Halovibrio sp. HP20-59 TaxID=3080275 RepID=UPI00294B388F|nr:RidA family protein [Halovibrio sp. HP20-59]MEA2117540.1 RidA family protein [Halovibrio sp. HP20-59]